MGTKADLIAQPEDLINWNALDDFTTPAGGAWPRFIAYTGTDVGIFAWAKSRPIEELTYTATGAITIDARDARIHQSTVVSNGFPVSVRYRQKGYSRLTLVGELDDFSLDVTGPEAPILSLTFPERRGGVRALIANPAFETVEDLTVSSAPLGAPFDCASLSAFPALTSLSVFGAVTGLETLAERDLTRLASRHVPNLDGVPPLSSWPRLRSFIAWNVDEVAGRRLRSELKKIGPLEGHGSVSQLRSRRWFVEEFGLPFAGWPKRSAARAVKAYKAASSSLTRPVGETAARQLIDDFVTEINSLPNIETSEREDVGEAVRLLAEQAGIAPELALTWLDDIRDF